jgi:hypothetical protein
MQIPFGQEVYRRFGNLTAARAAGAFTVVKYAKTADRQNIKALRVMSA